MGVLSNEMQHQTIYFQRFWFSNIKSFHKNCELNFGKSVEYFSSLFKTPCKPEENIKDGMLRDDLSGIRLPIKNTIWKRYIFCVS